MKLAVFDVSKTYNSKVVLQGCSVSFLKRGVHVLTGTNGSGKSTFLRICALLESPDTGEINFYSEGEVLKKDIELKRKITLVLPGIGAFNTTVYKNVSYGLKVRGMKREDIEERTMRALEIVRLTHKKDYNAHTLSSGELQRLGIARAVVIEPEILFLDEPTAYIDQENTEIIEDIITTMKKQHDSTVIISTHYREQAKRLADRLLVIQNGRIFDK